MSCRNCGRDDLPLLDVTLDGERAVEVTLCVRCTREYEDIGWVADTSGADEIEDSPAGVESEDGREPGDDAG